MRGVASRGGPVHRNTYNDQIVRLFLLSAAGWGVIGMAIGVFAAAQLAWPALNTDIPWLSFSRIRPAHTFGVIFAFGGSALMGTCYYVVQRTGHVRLAYERLAHFTYWGWQVACLLTIVTVPLGFTVVSRTLFGTPAAAANRSLTACTSR